MDAVSGMTMLTLVIVVISALAVLLPLILIGLSIAKRLRGPEVEAPIAEWGEPATATIQHVRETGDFVDGNPKVTIVLLVFRQGCKEYLAEIKTAVAPDDVPKLRGLTVPVRIDPRDSNRVAIDWNTLLANQEVAQQSIPQQLNESPYYEEFMTAGQRPCPTCGQELPVGATSCAFCGNAVK